ncbi:N-acetyltransferase [Blautia schinkii]|nr:N-acetyltransferase [Blautia schinkii]
MELIKLTHENIETEHICCAIANNKDCQVLSKKTWLKERLDEGLVFLKCNVRGKCFIEYIPAEYAWAPVEAPGYMYINCLWVSGQFKGQGYSNLLLEECIRDSKEKGKKGLVILSSKKKLGYLSDPKYMKYKGFETVDSANPYFELMYLPFDKKVDKDTEQNADKKTGEDAGTPHFKTCVKENGNNDMQKGFTVYYTSQCPFTAKYVPLMEEVAKKRNVNFQAIYVQTKEQAQNALIPFTTFSLFYDGEFITHEIQSEKKFEKLLEERGL